MLKLFHLFFIGLLTTKGISQTLELRKGEIEKMQAETIRCLDDKSTICSEGFKIEFEKSSSDLEPIPYQQTARFCQCQGSYSVYSGEFSGFHWSISAFFYFIDEQLFFARFQGGEKNALDESMVYFDEQGRIIQILNKVYGTENNLEFEMEEINDAVILIQAEEEIKEALLEVREVLFEK